MDIRSRYAKVVEEDIRKQRVVVLPGMHDYVFHFRRRGRASYRRELDELGASTDN